MLVGGARVGGVLEASEDIVLLAVCCVFGAVWCLPCVACAHAHADRAISQGAVGLDDAGSAGGEHAQRLVGPGPDALRRVCALRRLHHHAPLFPALLDLGRAERVEPALPLPQHPLHDEHDGHGLSHDGDRSWHFCAAKS